MTSVAVIIVGYRCPDEIVGCLAALARSNDPPLDVHICENGGEESFRSLSAAIASAGAQIGHVLTKSKGAIRQTITFEGAGPFHLKIHRASRNLGYAGGINAVLDVIASDQGWRAVWILNPDTEVAPDALGALQARAGLDHYGIVGSRIVLKHSGRIQMYGGGRWRRWIARGWNIGLGQPSDAEPDVDAVERVMDYVCGASMYVTRAFIEAVGRMDDRYFLYAEEVDWCLRRGRFRLGYAHDSVVYHTHGATIGSNHDRRSRSPFSVYLDERNRLLITRRFDAAMLPFVAFSTLGVLGQQYLLAGACRNFAAGIAGWFAGLRGKTGMPERFVSVLGLATTQQQQRQDIGDVRSTPQARHDVVSNPVGPSR